MTHKAMKFLKQYFYNVFNSWKSDVDRKSLSFHEVNKNALVLDLGCGNGEMTMMFANKIRCRNKVVGLEGIRALIPEAKKRGVDCRWANLEEKLPYTGETFDVVISHFSLEHLLNIDGFLSEIRRVLKPQGYAVIATDNLSSWANIVAMILGYHPFSLTPGISDVVLGNPFALHIGESGVTWANKQSLGIREERLQGTQGHIRVLAYQALKDLIYHHNLILEKITGAGYLFFGGTLASILSSLDPRRAHFLVVKLRKT